MADFGIDSEYTFARGPSGPYHGFTVRPLLTVSFTRIYCRYGQRTRPYLARMLWAARTSPNSRA
jgi:hypothetical protein